jgi:hypothetical protein
MRSSASHATIAAPRLTAICGLVLALGVLVQGLSAGSFLQGHHGWQAWHEALGDALVLPPLVSLLTALMLMRREADSRSVVATRAFLLVLVVVVVVTGHAGTSLLAVHIPAAIGVVAIAVRQATGFARVPNLRSSERAELS